ncbi:transposase [Caulobacter sp. SLTY]|uniref:REP-associated tyrosine transposase n=1 Tax=Caulobacter sp. SLTY TaxID=2683262 RepID=UPI001413319B|nr:transposase [Caulobacter sp. SLTY]NBB13813.1 transposase [Caulobacter sp. SLTY]
MPRTARLVVPGLPHHVTQRGNRRQTTFFSAQDYAAYRALLADRCLAHQVEVLAWCLMPNHVHLVLVPATGTSLGAALAQTHRRYTVRINRREGWTGFLWQGRFSSAPMDEGHLAAAVRYVELNPVRAGLVASPADWPWSSARAHLARAPDGLTAIDPMLDRFPDWEDFLGVDLSAPDLAAIRSAERTGRPLGARDFVARLEAGA